MKQEVKLVQVQAINSLVLALDSAGRLWVSGFPIGDTWIQCPVPEVEVQPTPRPEPLRPSPVVGKE